MRDDEKGEDKNTKGLVFLIPNFHKKAYIKKHASQSPKTTPLFIIKHTVNTVKLKSQYKHLWFLLMCHTHTHTRICQRNPRNLFSRKKLLLSDSPKNDHQCVVFTNVILFLSPISLMVDASMDFTSKSLPGSPENRLQGTETTSQGQHYD